jgi:hypothetical protein
MWLIPLLLIGVIVVAAKSPRESTPPPRQLAAPPIPAVPTVPGPIAVLGEILRIGQVPPPPVVLCAIAEAQAIGRDDLASDIAQHVVPVVHRHQFARSRPTYERGTCAPAPRAHVDYQRGTCAPIPAGSPREARGTCAPPTPRADVMSGVAVPQVAARHATQEEILAMLHSDPSAFLKVVGSGRPPVIEVPVPQAPVVIPAAPAPVPSAAPSTGLPTEAVAQMQEAAGLHQAADQTRAMAPGSPIATVPDGTWREFTRRLERESPEFTSSRHVGQYRQRRDRLAELGIDPNAIHGSAVAQRAALDADLADAHGHAAAGGVLAEHLGRAIAVPGREGTETITLSGVLGVIQCAGLEGAVGWLERPGDRKRYPHTTQTFLRTNGVF